MPGILAIAAVALVELHAPSGQVIAINPSQVSSLRAPLDVSGHWGKGTRCVVVMSNGGFNAVVEDCATVERMLGK